MHKTTGPIPSTWRKDNNNKIKPNLRRTSPPLSPKHLAKATHQLEYCSLTNTVVLMHSLGEVNKEKASLQTSYHTTGLHFHIKAALYLSYAHQQKPWRILLTGPLTHSFLAIFLLWSETICPGFVLSTLCWGLLHQLAMKAGQNLGNSSTETPFPGESGLCQVDN